MIAHESRPLRRETREHVEISVAVHVRERVRSDDGAVDRIADLVGQDSRSQVAEDGELTVLPIGRLAERQVDPSVSIEVPGLQREDLIPDGDLLGAEDPSPQVRVDMQLPAAASDDVQVRVLVEVQEEEVAQGVRRDGGDLEQRPQSVVGVQQKRTRHGLEDRDVSGAVPVQIADVQAHGMPADYVRVRGGQCSRTVVQQDRTGHSARLWPCSGRMNSRRRPESCRCSCLPLRFGRWDGAAGSS